MPRHHSRKRRRQPEPTWMDEVAARRPRLQLVQGRQLWDWQKAPHQREGLSLCQDAPGLDQRFSQDASSPQRAVHYGDRRVFLPPQCAVQDGDGSVFSPPQRAGQNGDHRVFSPRWGDGNATLGGCSSQQESWDLSDTRSVREEDRHARGHRLDNHSHALGHGLDHHHAPGHGLDDHSHAPGHGLDDHSHARGHGLDDHSHALGHGLDHHHAPGHGLDDHSHALGHGLDHHHAPGHGLDDHSHALGHGLDHHHAPGHGLDDHSHALGHGLDHHLAPGHGLDDHSHALGHGLDHHHAPGHGLDDHSHALGHGLVMGTMDKVSSADSSLLNRIGHFLHQARYEKRGGKEPVPDDSTVTVHDRKYVASAGYSETMPSFVNSETEMSHMQQDQQNLRQVQEELSLKVSSLHCVSVTDSEQEAWSSGTVPQCNNASVSNQPAQDHSDDDGWSESGSLARLDALKTAIQELVRGRKPKTLDRREKVMLKEYNRKIQKLMRRKKRMRKLHAKLQRLQGHGTSLSTGPSAVKLNTEESVDICSKYYCEKAELLSEQAVVVCNIEKLKCDNQRIEGPAKQQLKELNRRLNSVQLRLGCILKTQRKFLRKSQVGLQGIDPFSVLDKVSGALSVWRQTKYDESCQAEEDHQELLGDAQEQDQQEEEDQEVIEVCEGQREQPPPPPPQEDGVVVVSDEEAELVESRQSYANLASQHIVSRSKKQWMQLLKEKDLLERQKKLSKRIDHCVEESSIMAEVNQSYFLIAGLANVLLSQQQRRRQSQHHQSIADQCKGNLRPQEESGPGAGCVRRESGPEAGCVRQGQESGQQWGRREDVTGGEVAEAESSENTSACCRLIAQIAHNLELTPQHCKERCISMHKIAVACWQRERQQQQH